MMQKFPYIFFRPVYNRIYHYCIRSVAGFNEASCFVVIQIHDDTAFLADPVIDSVILQRFLGFFRSSLNFHEIIVVAPFYAFFPSDADDLLSAFPALFFEFGAAVSR